MVVVVARLKLNVLFSKCQNFAQDEISNIEILKDQYLEPSLSLANLDLQGQKNVSCQTRNSLA